MFDTILGGLPLHALVVHATVVLLPLMSLLTILVAIWPKWRKTSFALGVLVADLVVYGMAFVTQQSGEKLQARLDQFSPSPPELLDHAKWGQYLPWFALALAVAAALLYLGLRIRGALLPIAVVLVILSGGAATAWTGLVGHTGAVAVWRSTISNTHDPK
jgi:hypothetical protein